MTAFLPSNLLALFAPRQPIRYLPPLDKARHQRKAWPYKGVSDCLALFEDPNETPPPTRAETRIEKGERKKKERLEKNKLNLEKATEEWDPNTDPNASTDAFKTLFIGRINHDTSDSKLRREMEVYGAVKTIKMVVNKTTGKPRGYAFIEFEHERDMHCKYWHNCKYVIVLVLLQACRILRAELAENVTYEVTRCYNGVAFSIFHFQVAFRNWQGWLKLVQKREYSIT